MWDECVSWYISCSRLDCQRRHGALNSRHSGVGRKGPCYHPPQHRLGPVDQYLDARYLVRKISHRVSSFFVTKSATLAKTLGKIVLVSKNWLSTSINTMICTTSSKSGSKSFAVVLLRCPLIRDIFHLLVRIQCIESKNSILIARRRRGNDIRQPFRRYRDSHPASWRRWRKGCQRKALSSCLSWSRNLFPPYIGWPYQELGGNCATRA